jgi:hypothetical protein
VAAAAATAPTSQTTGSTPFVGAIIAPYDAAFCRRQPAAEVTWFRVEDGVGDPPAGPPPAPRRLRAEPLDGDLECRPVAGALSPLIEDGVLSMLAARYAACPSRVDLDERWPSSAATCGTRLAKLRASMASRLPGGAPGHAGMLDRVETALRGAWAAVPVPTPDGAAAVDAAEGAAAAAALEAANGGR